MSFLHLPKKKKIQKLGFNNIINVKNNQILKMRDFECISVFDNNVSNHDCGIAFRNKKYCIYHETKGICF